MGPYEVIIRPVLSEKTVALTRQNKYVFEVNRRANKTEVRRAVEAIFPDVRVGSVNTMLVPGKPRRLMGYRRRRGGLGEGYTSRRKKAVVTLTQGRIAVFEGA